MKEVGEGERSIRQPDVRDIERRKKAMRLCCEATTFDVSCRVPRFTSCMHAAVCLAVRQDGGFFPTLNNSLLCPRFLCNLLNVLGRDIALQDRNCLIDVESLLPLSSR